MIEIIDGEALSFTPTNYIDENSTFNVWLERGFSRREIGARMLACNPNLQIFSTSEQPLAGTKVVDFPDQNEYGYDQKAQAIVNEHSIHAIWLQSSAPEVMNTLGCEVHTAASAEVMTLVDDKIAFSQWLGNDPMRADAIAVTGAEAIANEYEKRHAEGREVCIKPVVGVGGQGYWRLTDVLANSFLEDPEDRNIHPDIYLAALSKLEATSDPRCQMIMDWLPGPEVSLDILCWRGVPLIHAVRTKVDGMHRASQRVQSEHATVNHAREVVSRLAMHGIVSVQYRLDQMGEWKMLEVNPRPAGGSVHSEDAGFGIISGWTNLVTHQVNPEKVQQIHDDVTLNFKRVAIALRQ